MSKISRARKMLPQKKDALFLDTSIHIARVVHSPRTKQKIRDTLAGFPKTATGLVARQEFKRRLLKEANYLLGLLNRYQSFDEVYHHVVRLFPFHQRKRTICLQAFGDVHGGSDAERAERLRCYLHSLLVTGLRRFDQSVDEVVTDSGCDCGKTEIVEKVALKKYEFGTDQCSKTKAGACRIDEFFKANQHLRLRILEKLRAIPPEKKSTELEKAEQFLDQCAQKPGSIQPMNPCLAHGDLFIAMESAGFSHVLTLNGVESQHLCRALDQSLIVRPISPEKPDVVCNAEDVHWPDFGPNPK